MSSFIKVRKTLPHDPALRRIVEAVGVSLDVVLAGLLRLAVWASDHAPRGIAPVTAAYLDELTGIAGFAAALTRLGWLEARLHEVCVLPFWEDGGSRRRSSRLAQADAVAEGARLAQVLPACLDTAGFRQLWQDWLSHRVALRVPLTRPSASRQLARLEQLGLQRAQLALEYSLEKGWRGIYEPSSGAQQQTKQQQQQRQQEEQQEEDRIAALVAKQQQDLAQQRALEERLRQERDECGDGSEVQSAQRQERGPLP